MLIVKVVGIDLGTTNSVVAMMDLTNEKILTHTDRQGRHIIPSVVGIDPKTAQLITGYRAYSYRGTRNQPVVSVKRLMGSSDALRLGEREFRPEDISSEIIAECIRCMKAQLDQLGDDNEYRVEEAIITVPAYFDVNATDATRRAGELAGVKVSVLQEPTAAAMYYIWKHNLPEGNYLVFDLGGGTFDVSIVNKSMGIPTVLALSGNNYLGGDDFDRRLARDLLEILQESGEYDLDLDDEDPEDRLRYTKLVLKAEELKKELSSKTEVFFESSNIFEDKEGRSVRVDLHYSRERFEELVGDLIDAAMRECDNALNSAIAEKKISGIEDIQQVLLVGGSTKVPLVRQRVADRFCSVDKPHVKNLEILCDEPDFAVGFGAALCATVGGVRYLEEGGISLTVRQDEFADSLDLMGTLGGLNDLESYRVNVKNETGAKIGDSRIAVDGSFTVHDVDTSGGQFMMIEVVASDGKVVLERPVQLEKSVDIVASPSVMPMDINLDVWDEGEEQLVKKTLIKKLTPLPMNVDYTLYANENTRESMVFKLYQGASPMKEITIELTDRKLDVGEPVKINVQCDATFHVTVDGQIAGKPLKIDVSVAPKEHDPIALRDEQKQLRSEFEKRLQLFSGGDRGSFMAEERMLAGLVEDGFEDNELAKVADKLALYLEMVERMKMPTFDPPRERFEELLQMGRAMVQEIRRKDTTELPPDYSEAEATSILRRLEEEGYQAYDRQDRRQVSEIGDKLLEQVRFLYRILDPGDTVPPAERLRQMIQSVVSELENFVVMNNPEKAIRDQLNQAVRELQLIKNGISDLMDESACSERQRQAAAILQAVQPLLAVKPKGPNVLTGKQS